MLRGLVLMCKGLCTPMSWQRHQGAYIATFNASPSPRNNFSNFHCPSPYFRSQATKWRRRNNLVCPSFPTHAPFSYACARNANAFSQCTCLSARMRGCMCIARCPCFSSRLAFCLNDRVDHSSDSRGYRG